MGQTTMSQALTHKQAFHFARRTLPTGVASSIAHVVADTSAEAHASLLLNCFEGCATEEWIPAFSVGCAICATIREQG